ncbi:MAG: imidazolonepropionase [Anaerolineae bacterium]
MKTLLHSARQLITCAAPDGKPKRGAAMCDVGMIEDGAVVIDGETIIAVGKTFEIREQYPNVDHEIDASGKVVCPGFVDPHTHAVWAGDRLDEFEQRIGGATYMQIMAAGGGINRTVQATRAAPREVLLMEAILRLDQMLRLGSTTVEIKTGYGLNTSTEIQLLMVIFDLMQRHRVDIVPTFLAAHAVPPEYKGRTDEYVDLVCREMIPSVGSWFSFARMGYGDMGIDPTRLSPHDVFAVPRPPRVPPSFVGKALTVDVFCEEGVFSVEQSQRIWAAAKQHGLGIRAHVDEFKSLGGVTAAVQAGAVSVDHLDVTTDAEIRVLAASNTIGVVLPAVNFNLGSHHYANARGMIDAGAAIALATDLNPGSAPCPSMPLVMAIACRYQKLLPAEALNASTINAAHAIGMGDRVGSIEVGKQADLLIVDAPDYREIVYTLGGNPVERVIKRGAIL